MSAARGDPGHREDANAGSRTRTPEEGGEGDQVTHSHARSGPRNRRTPASERTKHSKVGHKLAKFQQRVTRTRVNACKLLEFGWL